MTLYLNPNNIHYSQVYLYCIVNAPSSFTHSLHIKPDHGFALCVNLILTRKSSIVYSTCKQHRISQKSVNCAETRHDCFTLQYIAVPRIVEW